METSTDWSDYWKNRWNKGDIGWHQSDPEPGMVSFFSGKPNLRILVPLCGKSRDMVWLLEQGHEILGIELSELACQSFFEENKIPFEKVVVSGSAQYRGPQITLFNQDVFKITPEQLGKIDAVYDRAALIALPPELRKRYASHLTSLVRECSSSSFEFCQIILERIPSDPGGPPFSVSEETLRGLYEASFSLELLSRETVETTEKHRKDESVFRLKRK